MLQGVVAALENPAGFIGEVSGCGADLGLRHIGIGGSGEEEPVDIGEITEGRRNWSHKKLMDFSLQLQCCFQLAGDGGADAFGDKNNIIIFRERNVFQLGERSFYCQFYDGFQFRWGAAVEGVDVLAVVKADDFITTFSSHGSSIIEKGLGAGITDTWENDGKFFHVGTSLES